MKTFLPLTVNLWHFLLWFRSGTFIHRIYRRLPLISFGARFWRTRKFSHSKSRFKMSDLLTTEVFYAHILNMNRGSLHTRRFRRIYFFAFKYRFSKMALRARKVSGAFDLRAPVLNIQLRKGVLVGLNPLKQKAFYLERLISGIKKRIVSKWATAVLIKISFWNTNF